MVVKNVDDEQLEAICHELAIQIFESGFCPDMIIGIRAGGIFPSVHIYKYLQSFYGKKITLGAVSVNNHRWYRLGFISGCYTLLPYCLLDLLRILSLRFKSRTKRKNSSVILRDIEPGCKKILVVDDAVDTGNTLDAVLTTLKQNYPQIEVKTAVLTVTMDNPVVVPDFTAFQNHTILRLPWASDAK